MALPCSATCESSLPERPADAESGTAFVGRMKDLGRAEREQAIIESLLAGNFPDHLRKLHDVRVVKKLGEGNEQTLVYKVMPDYLAIGSDADWVRMPMTPMSAQRIADEWGFTLPTAQMVDQIYAAAEVKLAPRPLTERREAMATFAKHHQFIQQQRAGQPLGKLVAGVKKDVVLTVRLAERERRVAIYGWHRLSGVPIQPLTTVHTDTYVDYSHGVRLVQREMTIDGESIDFQEVASDPVLHLLLSGEGPLDVLRYSSHAPK